MTFMHGKRGLVIGLAVALWQSAAVAGSSPATLFDERVGAGLPQSFSLPRLATDERGEGVDQVVVEEKLDTDVVYPDGAHATTYIGTANGVEATFTRIGDIVSVSVFSEKYAVARTASALRGAMQPEPDDVVVAPEQVTFSSPPVAHATVPLELQFWIFLHDQAGESNYAKFHSWYIAWWVRDMERTVKPGLPVKVFIKDHIAGVTDFDYHKGTNVEALVAFRQVAADYMVTAGATSPRLAKSMLFIGKRPAHWYDYYGIALQRDTVAIASRTGPRHVIAHEFGHSMDARHEHGETRFPCVTNMMGYTFGLYSCRIYSGLNDVQIREHVKEAVELIENGY